LPIALADLISHDDRDSSLAVPAFSFGGHVSDGFGPGSVEAPTNAFGLIVLIVVWGATRLVFVLDASTTVAYLREAVARHAGQAVRIVHVNRMLKDSETIPRRGGALVAVEAARHDWLPTVSAQQAAIPNVGDLAAADSVTREREREKVLFTPAVRRAIYNVFLNPHRPGAPNATPSAAASAAIARGRVPFEVCVRARSSQPFVFQTLADDGVVLDVDDSVALLDTIKHIGDPTPDGVALAEAFEAWLAERARGWTTADVAELPVEFLIAFGRELTPRLDIGHRIRSTKLSEDELATLSQPPFCHYVDATLLASFQGR